MRGDQAEYDMLPGKLIHRVWRSAGPGSWAVREIALGTYGLNGWFVHRTGRRWAGCWTFHFERDACDWVDHCQAQATGWVELPVDEQMNSSSINAEP